MGFDPLSIDTWTQQRLFQVLVPTYIFSMYWWVAISHTRKNNLVHFNGKLTAQCYYNGILLPQSFQLCRITTEPSYSSTRNRIQLEYQLCSYRETTLLFFPCLPNSQTSTLQNIFGMNWTDVSVKYNLRRNHCNNLYMRYKQCSLTFHSSLFRICRFQAVSDFNDGHMWY